MGIGWIGVIALGGADETIGVFLPVSADGLQPGMKVFTALEDGQGLGYLALQRKQVSSASTIIFISSCTCR